MMPWFPVHWTPREVKPFFPTTVPPLRPASRSKVKDTVATPVICSIWKEKGTSLPLSVRPGAERDARALPCWAAVTVTWQLAVRPLLAAAVMTALPAFLAVRVPEASTEATDASELDQVTVRLEAFSGRTVACRVVLLPSVRESC